MASISAWCRREIAPMGAYCAMVGTFLNWAIGMTLLNHMPQYWNLLDWGPLVIIAGLATILAIWNWRATPGMIAAAAVSWMVWGPIL